MKSEMETTEHGPSAEMSDESSHAEPKDNFENNGVRVPTRFHPGMRTNKAGWWNPECPEAAQRLKLHEIIPKCPQGHPNETWIHQPGP